MSQSQHQLPHQPKLAPIWIWLTTCLASTDSQLDAKEIKMSKLPQKKKSTPPLKLKPKERKSSQLQRRLAQTKAKRLLRSTKKHRSSKKSSRIMEAKLKVTLNLKWDWLDSSQEPLNNPRSSTANSGENQESILTSSMTDTLTSNSSKRSNSTAKHLPSSKTRSNSSKIHHSQLATPTTSKRKSSTWGILAQMESPSVAIVTSKTLNSNMMLMMRSNTLSKKEQNKAIFAILSQSAKIIWHPIRIHSKKGLKPKYSILKITQHHRLWE